MKPRILITAANGNTGFPAAKELLTMGFRVRAFVRNPKSDKASILKKSGAEIFTGDIENINDVRTALKDVDRAYFVPTYPNVLFQGETFATAAEEMGTPHIAVLTQWLSSNTHHSSYTKEHWLVDQAFKRLKGTNVIFLNPGFFAFVYFMTPEPLTQFGMLPDFGENAPPSSEDIGLVAAHVLKDPEAHKGQTYRITGRELITPDQMASTIGEVLGRKVKASKMDLKMIFKVLKASGVNKIDASQIQYYIQEGFNGTWKINSPTSVVKDIVGKEADNFETIARNYIGSHPLAKQSFSNKMKGVLFMIKMLFTSAWNMEKFEKERGVPRFQGMMYSSESPEWMLGKSNTPVLEKIVS